MGELTEALADLRAGDSGTAAVNVLFNETYGELKRLAHQRLQRGRPSGLLDTTSVVHESYLRFLDAERIEIRDRAHFLAYASKVMRSVIVDIVRRGAAARRGGDVTLLTLGHGLRELLASDEDLLKLDDALNALARVDPQLVQIVELRYFAGLSVEEVAEYSGVSPRTVARLWEKARLVLLDELSQEN
jgi:RNA polymerase sigma factor (TIGR02999 family)